MDGDVHTIAPGRRKISNIFGLCGVKEISANKLDYYSTAPWQLVSNAVRILYVLCITHDFYDSNSTQPNLEPCVAIVPRCVRSEFIQNSCRTNQSSFRTYSEFVGLSTAHSAFIQNSCRMPSELIQEFLGVRSVSIRGVVRSELFQGAFGTHSEVSHSSLIFEFAIVHNSFIHDLELIQSQWFSVRIIVTIEFSGLKFSFFWIALLGPRSTQGASKDHQGSIWRQSRYPGTILKVFCGEVFFWEI